MITPKPTGYANSKRRVIYRNPRTGAFYVKTAKGMRRYSPTASFRMTNNRKAVRITANTRNKIPMKIRPSAARILAADAKKRAEQRNANKKANYDITRVFEAVRPGIRKIRSDFGKARNLIASPGSTIYRGKTAMQRLRVSTSKPRTLNNIRANLVNKGFNPRAAARVA